jgi:hypothetical protein
VKQLLAVLAFASAALAQPTEHITVTGTRESPRLAAEHFVARFTVPSAITGKAARWDESVCPVTVGWGKNMPPISPPTCAPWRNRWVRL